MNINNNLLETISIINNLNITIEKSIINLLKKYLKSDFKFIDKDGYIFICNGSKCSGTLLHKEKSGGYFKLSIIVSPQRNLSYIDNFNKIRGILKGKEYKIYKVLDGSLIYLSFINSSWMFSNKNVFNYSINDKRHILGGLITECIDIDKLDKNYTYAYTIRHNKLHPLCEKPTSFLHFIMKNGKRYYSEELEEVQPVDITLDEIEKIINSPPDKNELGYIFRGDNIDIIIETSLCKFIRTIIYNTLYNRINRRDLIKKGYKLYPQKNILKELFIDFGDIFKEVDDEIDLLCEDIYKGLIDYTYKPTNTLLFNKISLIISTKDNKDKIYIISVIKDLLNSPEYGRLY